ncbi:beta subunit of fatty acid synthetase, partial [Coemansia sp. IMI 209127]
MDAIAVFSGIYSDSGSQMDEITWLYDVYCPLLSDYVASMSAFMDSVAKDGQAALAYPGGLDIFGWLSKPSSAPATEYLSQHAVSAPLFGLKQFMRIMVLYKTLGMSPGQFVDQFKAIVGHSHGLAIAAAFSTLTDESSFYTVSKKVMGILLLAGAMPHNAQMANSMTGMAVANGDARSMVLVQGISVGDLNKSVTAFNKRQSADTDCVHMALADVGDTPIVAAKQSASTRFINHLQHEWMKDSNIAASGCSDSLESLVRTANDNGWALDSSNMRLPVYTIDGGRSICDEPDLT